MCIILCVLLLLFINMIAVLFAVLFGAFHNFQFIHQMCTRCSKRMIMALLLLGFAAAGGSGLGCGVSAFFRTKKKPLENRIRFFPHDSCVQFIGCA